jgi:hypothetical protein
MGRGARRKRPARRAMGANRAGLPSPSRYKRDGPGPARIMVSAIAFHEAGHAVAVVQTFRNAAWLPRRPPSLLVRSIGITEHASGLWSGDCMARDIYSTTWPLECIAQRYRPLMETRVTIELAGGLAEAVYCGERRAREALAFAELHCSIDDDLTRAAPVLADLFRLTGCRFDMQEFAERIMVDGALVGRRGTGG